MQTKILAAVGWAIAATAILGVAEAAEQGLELRGPIDLPTSAPTSVPLILPPQVSATASQSAALADNEAAEPKDKKRFWAIPHPHLHLPVISLKPRS